MYHIGSSGSLDTGYRLISLAVVELLKNLLRIVSGEFSVKGIPLGL